MLPQSGSPTKQSEFGDLKQTTAALVRQYPLASLGVAAGAAFMFVRVKWLREAAVELLASQMRQHTNAGPLPPHD